MSTDRQQESQNASKADISSAKDNEDLNKQRRLNAIHDAREAVVEARRRVDEALHYGEISQLTANTILRREVENFVHEVEWLMDEAETRQDYWGGADLGTMRLPDGNTFKFVGLQSVLEAADPIEYSWETEENDEWDGRQVQTHRKRMQIPRDVLMNAYRAVNGFLFEIGLDITLDEGEEEYYFDYSDLIGPDEEDPRETESDIQ